MVLAKGGRVATRSERLAIVPSRTDAAATEHSRVPGAGAWRAEGLRDHDLDPEIATE